MNNVGLEDYLAGVCPGNALARWTRATRSKCGRWQALVCARKSEAGRLLRASSVTRGARCTAASSPRSADECGHLQTVGEIRTPDEAGRGLDVLPLDLRRTHGGNRAHVDQCAACKGHTSSQCPIARLLRRHSRGPFRHSRAALDAEARRASPGGLDGVTINGSRRISQVLAKGTTGSTSISASRFRSRSNARPGSGWCPMNLKTAQRQVALGSRTRLTSLALVHEAWLERRPEGGVWSALRDLTRLPTERSPPASGLELPRPTRSRRRPRKGAAVRVS